MTSLFTADRRVLAKLQVHCHVAWVVSFLLMPAKKKSKLYYDRRSVGQSLLVSSPHFGPNTGFFLLSGSCEFVDVGPPFWREDGSVVYSCCWSSPALSFLGPSPAELTTVFYCQIQDTPNLQGQAPIFISPRNRVAQLYPEPVGSLFVASNNWQGYGGGIRTRLHIGN
jgi:hypothetical protein